MGSFYADAMQRRIETGGDRLGLLKDGFQVVVGPRENHHRTKGKTI